MAVGLELFVLAHLVFTGLLVVGKIVLESPQLPFCTRLLSSPRLATASVLRLPSIPSSTTHPMTSL